MGREGGGWEWDGEGGEVKSERGSRKWGGDKRKGGEEGKEGCYSGFPIHLNFHAKCMVYFSNHERQAYRIHCTLVLAPYT